MQRKHQVGTAGDTVCHASFHGMVQYVLDSCCSCQMIQPIFIRQLKLLMCQILGFGAGKCRSYFTANCSSSGVSENTDHMTICRAILEGPKGSMGITSCQVSLSQRQIEHEISSTLSEKRFFFEPFALKKVHSSVRTSTSSYQNLFRGSHPMKGSGTREHP